MIRVLKFVVIVFFSLCLFSCGKKRTIHITATNGATGVRYAGLQYFVVSSTTTGGGEKYKTEKSGFLNENGEATEVVREKQFRTYAVRVVEPENSCYNKEITMYFGGANDKNGHFDFVFAECATLQRKVKNINCFDTSDKIEIYIDNTVHSLLPAPWILNGCVDYTTVPTKVPIGNYTLHWIVTKNNVSTDYYDSFNLIENETKIHEINY